MKQILCFGDSNTYGLIPGTSERYNWSVRWTGILDQSLSQKGYRIIEEGLCGRTTVFEDPLRDGRKGTAIFPTVLETHQPLELVVLMLGTNDCKTVYDASSNVIGKGMERLVDQVHQKQP
nr:GDSL-type esterase/lipase family protein [Anaerostipes sp. 494a]